MGKANVVREWVSGETERRVERKQRASPLICALASSYAGTLIVASAKPKKNDNDNDNGNGNGNGNLNDNDNGNDNDIDNHLLVVVKKEGNLFLVLCGGTTPCRKGHTIRRIFTEISGCIFANLSWFWLISIRVNLQEGVAVFIHVACERRNVTSRYHGSTISGWQQNQRRRRRQGERQKIICLYQQTTTLHEHQDILYIALLSFHHYDMKLPNFISPVFGVGEHNTKVVAFFF